MSDLLQQAVASGQVSAAQIEAHQKASELGSGKAVQAMPDKSDVQKQIEAALVNMFTSNVSNLTSANKVDWIHYDCVVNPTNMRKLLAEHDQVIESLRSELEAANDTLKFVERCANHHGAKLHMTAKEALSCIQHYPPIVAITRSYGNGKVPETRNPWAELEAARAALIEINDTLPGTATPQQYARHIHKIACAALCNTKEQIK